MNNNLREILKDNISKFYIKELHQVLITGEDTATIVLVNNYSDIVERYLKKLFNKLGIKKYRITSGYFGRAILILEKNINQGRFIAPNEVIDFKDIETIHEHIIIEFPKYKYVTLESDLEIFAHRSTAVMAPGYTPNYKSLHYKSNIIPITIPKGTKLFIGMERHEVTVEYYIAYRTDDWMWTSNTHGDPDTFNQIEQLFNS